MPRVVAYHRPESMEQALSLLGRPDTDTVVLAGGTAVNAGFQSLDVSPIEVVDLQALGLEGIDAHDGAVLHVGATTTLNGLAESTLVPAVLRELARAEAPSTLRNMATVGGLIAGAEHESALLAGLLAADASVEVVGAEGATVLSLASLLNDASALRGSIITSVELQTDGTFATDRTGRTPADTPIVAVVGRRRGDGSTVLAASGVAAVPVVVGDPAALQPPGDFRGSSNYRRSLATTLAARVRTALESQEAHQ